MAWARIGEGFINLDNVLSIVRHDLTVVVTFAVGGRDEKYAFKPYTRTYSLGEAIHLVRTALKGCTIPGDPAPGSEELREAYESLGIPFTQKE